MRCSLKYLHVHGSVYLNNKMYIVCDCCVQVYSFHLTTIKIHISQIIARGQIKIIKETLSWTQEYLPFTVIAFRGHPGPFAPHMQWV